MVNKQISTYIQTIRFSLDGSCGGVRYFETDPNRGLFCRPDKVQRLSINTGPQRHSLYNPSRLSTIGINSVIKTIYSYLSMQKVHRIIPQESQKLLN